MSGQLPARPPLLTLFGRAVFHGELLAPHVARHLHASPFSPFTRVPPTHDEAAGNGDSAANDGTHASMRKTSRTRKRKRAQKTRGRDIALRAWYNRWPAPPPAVATAIENGSKGGRRASVNGSDGTSSTDSSSSLSHSFDDSSASSENDATPRREPNLASLSSSHSSAASYSSCSGSSSFSTCSRSSSASRQRRGTRRLNRRKRRRKIVNAGGVTEAAAAASKFTEFAAGTGLPVPPLRSGITFSQASSQRQRLPDKLKHAEAMAAGGYDFVVPAAARLNDASRAGEYLLRDADAVDIEDTAAVNAAVFDALLPWVNALYIESLAENISELEQRVEQENGDSTLITDLRAELSDSSLEHDMSRLVTHIVQSNACSLLYKLFAFRSWSNRSTSVDSLSSEVVVERSGVVRQSDSYSRANDPSVHSPLFPMIYGAVGAARSFPVSSFSSAGCGGRARSNRGTVAGDFDASLAASDRLNLECDPGAVEFPAFWCDTGCIAATIPSSVSTLAGDTFERIARATEVVRDRIDSKRPRARPRPLALAQQNPSSSKRSLKRSGAVQTDINAAVVPSPLEETPLVMLSRRMDESSDGSMRRTLAETDETNRAVAAWLDAVPVGKYASDF